MKAKTALILAHLNKNGKVTVKMDRASGFSVVTITKRAGGYVVGTIPGDKLTRANIADLESHANSQLNLYNQLAVMS